MVQQVTDSEFLEILNNNEKIAVKFFAGWCGACRLFSPKFRRMSENEEFSGIRFLDINAEENPEARKLAGVNNLPFFAVFNNGELLEGDATSMEEVVEAMIRKLA